MVPALFGMESADMGHSKMVLPCRGMLLQLGGSGFRYEDLTCKSHW